jgi:hypothetical protein
MQSQPQSKQKRRFDARRREQAAAVHDDVFKGGAPTSGVRLHGLAHPWLLGTGRLWTVGRREERIRG